MSMFPGAGAQVYYNEAGEPLGWDYPSDEPDFPDPGDDNPEMPVICKCGERIWVDDEDDVVYHNEVCESGGIEL